ncbi:PIR Superfamily Protein [Plasmodium ovale wallikeri]|uniref:PIR Superfamily Protein n=2 Tax=Plasmodium ovale TaxID=36330 RepID=A0A1A9AQQ7_PLAOA|nr:PIR Superfamily Protein [Plasmodium ovale wallikeri]
MYKHFTSGELYDEMNNAKDSEQYSTYCINTKTQYSQCDGIHKICEMFVWNLKNLPKILEDEYDTDSHCAYLHFWMKYKIRKNIGANKRSPDIMQLRRGFFSFFLWGKIYGKELSYSCKYAYNHYTDLDLWRRWKYLYDYISKYHNLYDIISKNQDLCRKNKTYYIYIKGMHDSYVKKCFNKGTE